MIFGKMKTSSMIKDAVDNLPGGLCFFDGRGIPILVNRVMHNLIFQLTEQDIQDISDLDDVMKKTSEVRLPDGCVWQFQKRTVDESSGLTEITASDITELVKYQTDLEKRNKEQREVMDHLEELGRDVVEITRNEEILAMKMKIHSELGFALSATRRFIASNCKAEGKKDYIKKQREIVRKLLIQTDSDDEKDVFSELKKSAEKLGLEIVCEGEPIPNELEGIMTKIIRECLINVIRHGDGDKVFVKGFREKDQFKATIEDNGHSQSMENIAEGGGLSSIRKYVEECGGSMQVDTNPEFTISMIFTRGKELL